MPSDPFLPELAEADAPPGIAAIYRDIRHWSGVPMVALIFRHLATCPGVLPELWHALGPLFSSGAIPARAWDIAAAHAPGGLMPPIGGAARAAIGLDAAALAQVRGTLEAYNRANPINLLTMLCIDARLQGRGSATAPRREHWTPPPPIAVEMPAMTPPHAMPATLRELLAELTSAGTAAGAESAVPSLYRHLSAWPALLIVANVTLRPRFRDGTMAAAARALRGALAAEAERLACGMPPLPRLAAHPDARETVARFASTVIPEMVLVGQALAEALADAAPDDTHRAARRR